MTLATSADLPKILTLSLVETVDVHRKHPDKLLQVTFFGVSAIKIDKWHLALQTWNLAKFWEMFPAQRSLVEGNKGNGMFGQHEQPFVVRETQGSRDKERLREETRHAPDTNEFISLG